ncbi:hypothetical protein [Ramlibacter albus]|uniref:Uncharacterized protein n=1 Tax=Ramlibacter albus TaxID=2079448 RepID=A0A923S2Q1_9BURK|nr:hypothetical protein [Ramlibacter albus]MBC5765008.1 hypothetical protein [Ramlibacter albus]
MQEPVWIPAAAGELFDKLTILRIKRERMTDPGQLANVARELTLLEGIAGKLDTQAIAQALDAQVAELQAINGTLWDLENQVRAFARAADHGDGFVAAARSIYSNNDRRAAVKREINRLLGSPLVEEKDHSGGARR